MFIYLNSHFPLKRTCIFIAIQEQKKKQNLHNSFGLFFFFLNALDEPVKMIFMANVFIHDVI